ncbi:hypothetical protein B0H16DRAFT_1617248 [Mycena metata]|uniref:Uncharacterized protein n=1 Tax=Mycena metata TaxID=1033252 RepID=A0AAD7H908_9AGAR|nr:hypothetical protein B0H16DRAFT_1617248 [Mycena metata]
MISLIRFSTIFNMSTACTQTHGFPILEEYPSIKSTMVTQDQFSCLHSPHSKVHAGNTRIKASSGLSTQVLNNRASDANQTTVNTAHDSSLASVPSDEEFPAMHKAVASYFTAATNLIEHTNPIKKCLFAIYKPTQLLIDFRRGINNTRTTTTS